MKTSKEALELYKKLDSLWVANGVTPANKLYKESRTTWGEENSRYENKLERVDFKVAKKFIQLALKKFCKPSVYTKFRDVGPFLHVPKVRKYCGYGSAALAVAGCG